MLTTFPRFHFHLLHCFHSSLPTCWDNSRSLSKAHFLVKYFRCCMSLGKISRHIIACPSYFSPTVLFLAACTAPSLLIRQFFLFSPRAFWAFWDNSFFLIVSMCKKCPSLLYSTKSILCLWYLASTSSFSLQRNYNSSIVETKLKLTNNNLYALNTTQLNYRQNI